MTRLQTFGGAPAASIPSRPPAPRTQRAAAAVKKKCVKPDAKQISRMTHSADVRTCELCALEKAKGFTGVMHRVGKRSSITLADVNARSARIHRTARPKQAAKRHTPAPRTKRGDTAKLIRQTDPAFFDALIGRTCRDASGKPVLADAFAAHAEANNLDGHWRLHWSAWFAANKRLFMPAGHTPSPDAPAEDSTLRDLGV